MVHVESKTGKVPESEKKIYEFLSDFKNFEQLLPRDRVSNWHSEGESCSFSVNGLGEAGLKIIEKEPWKLIKISGTGQAALNFFLWIQIKEVRPGDSRIRLTIKAEMNQVMGMMARKPLQQFVNLLVDHLEKYFGS